MYLSCVRPKLRKWIRKIKCFLFTVDIISILPDCIMKMTHANYVITFPVMRFCLSDWNLQKNLFVFHFISYFVLLDLYSQIYILTFPAT
jgi:hypothetical protein